MHSQTSAERESQNLRHNTGFQALYGNSEFLGVGGLMSYGPSLPGLYHRAATYVDRILKGEKPANIPVEQPTNFYLAINMNVCQSNGFQCAALRARACRRGDR